MPGELLLREDALCPWLGVPTVEALPEAGIVVEDLWYERLTSAIALAVSADGPGVTRKAGAAE